MQGRERSSAATGLLLSLALAVACASPALAALPSGYQVQRIDGPEAQGTQPNRGGDRFGDGFVNAGDVNQDGEDDLLVGISRNANIPGKVFVISGADGSLLRKTVPPDTDVSSGPSDRSAAFGAYVGRMADFAGCTGVTAANNCNGLVPLPDGVPEQIVSAPGVDVDTPGVELEGNDMGIVYVVDGKTGGFLARLRMPMSDRQAQSPSNPGSAALGPNFGGAALSPIGLPPCSGFGGIGACDPVAPDVAAGDLSGGVSTTPEIIIGAPDFSETTSSHSTCSGGTGICRQAGRVYVYNLDSLSVPGAPLDQPLSTIKSPVAAVDPDDQPVSRLPEEFGAALTPIGDVGSCEPAIPNEPIYCLTDQGLGAASNARDGVPDFAVSAPRVDALGVPESGSAFVFDGETLRVINVITPLELQQTGEQGMLFSLANYNQPALGDISGDSTPDIYLPAPFKDVSFEAQGRGYVINGRPLVGSERLVLSRLDDPTPVKFGNFGTSSAGIGNVLGSSFKELLVGAYGGPDAPSAFSGVIHGDVHVFSPATDAVLQTISDPDRQPDGGFGRNVVPMGDLNDDGFLDYGVGAGGFDVTAANQGRLYLLRSDNSPPAPPPAGPGAGTGSRSTPAVARAGRRIGLEASRKRVARGRRVTLSGLIRAFTARATCEPGQGVEIQRRSRGKGAYRTFMRVTSVRNGKFSAKIRPRKTYLYRAHVAQSAQCLSASSTATTVKVRRAKKR